MKRRSANASRVAKNRTADLPRLRVNSQKSRSTSIPFIPYELKLERDWKWALNEGTRHFHEKSDVFAALQRIADKLLKMGIPYAVIGGMALFKHEFRRFTEVVEILVTKDDLKKIHNSLEELGYLRLHDNSKHLRDTELGVRMEFLTTGEYPGDGKEKPIAFPDPAAFSDEIDGIRFVNLRTLIELKLASGMTGSDPLKDLADVQELIKLLTLPASFADELNPYVQEKFRELWIKGQRRFVTLWRNKWLTADATDGERSARCFATFGGNASRWSLAGIGRRCRGRLPASRYDRPGRREEVRHDR